MATIISTKTSGVGGLSVTGDASGILQLASADGTTALTIDASQNVGIGTSSPSQKLHVAGNIFAAAGVSLGSAAGEGGEISFQSASGTNAGMIDVDGGNNWRFYNALATPTIFFTNSAERMRIDSSGNVGIGCTPSSLLSIQKYNPGGLGPELILNNSGNSISDSMAVTFASGAIGSGARGQIKVTVDNNPYYGIMTFSRGSSNATLVESMRIDSSGNLLVGTTGVTSSTVVSKSKGTDTYQGYNTNNAFTFAVSGVGQIYATSTTIATISDIRLKENVRHLDSVLLQVMDLKPRLFDWKEGKGKNIKNDRGFIAQEFEKVFPDLIDEWRDPAPKGEESYKSVRADLIPVLVKAIQELKAIIDTQNARIEALEAK